MLAAQSVFDESLVDCADLVAEQSMENHKPVSRVTLCFCKISALVMPG
jgi:hypothetical protein